VTVYRARTAPRAIFADATLRAATRTGARTAVAEETVKADMICESVCGATTKVFAVHRARGPARTLDGACM